MRSPTIEPGTWWRAARKALDTWGPSPEFTIAAAIRDAHADGLRRASRLANDRGERVLAMELRTLQQEVEKTPVVRAAPPRR